ncbi:unnamed protein product [Schistocephalus solidus]|uniref:4F5 domain-containing protein n=1 Tax=Schistocephalus solidus TaxID=70667 RepID=A0A183TN56_SCHSO|nr:unnamed protein product [Schistocephalus solidus]
MSGHDRKAELEQKKLKLAALREGRLKREGKLNDLAQSNFKVNLTSAGDAEAILRDFGLLNPLELNGKHKVDELTKSASTPAFSSKYPIIYL